MSNATQAALDTFTLLNVKYEDNHRGHRHRKSDAVVYALCRRLVEAGHKILAVMLLLAA
jgi:ribulose 1,5-bisphosphate synthetase/thiazole synthase